MAGVNQKDLNLFICLPLTHFIRKECHPQSCSVPSFHFSQHVLKTVDEGASSNIFSKRFGVIVFSIAFG